MSNTLNQTGRCTTCQNLFCPTPKVKQTHPHLGCPDWSTPEAADIAKTIRTITVPEALNS